MSDSRRRRQQAPDFQLTLTRAMLETLELRRILYVILSGVTAGDGLDFNRAFLMLADESRRTLRGQLAIGPASGEDAHRIWEEMEEQRFNLRVLMERYEAASGDSRASVLSDRLQKVSFPLPLMGEADDNEFLSMVRTVMDEKRPVLVGDRPVPFRAASVTLEQFAVVPVLLSDQAVGVLIVDNRYNKRSIHPTELDDLMSLANLAAIAVERARLHERIRQMAEIDGLTGLLNRRRFDERFPEVFAECRGHGEPLSVIMLDLDRFKAVNDLHGHLAGDDLLRGVAGIVLDRIRAGDIGARYGGDEVAVVLPGATAPEALKVAEHICGRVRAAGFGLNGRIRTTLSAGIAEIHMAHSAPSQLLEDADQALYVSKHEGGDRVICLLSTQHREEDKGKDDKQG